MVGTSQMAGSFHTVLFGGAEFSFHDTCAEKLVDMMVVLLLFLERVFVYGGCGYFKLC